MRMNAVLSNPKHPEYGQFTVPLPIPHNQYDGIMEALNAMDMGDPLARDCQMDEILGEYPILKRLEGKPVNIDELDYLAKRLDSFCYAQEGAQFQGAAVSYNYSDMTDLINLTFSCQQVTVITDFSDLEQVGRDHYMVLNGGCASKEELDGILRELEGASYRVEDVKQGERIKKAPIPFTTSTLQQEASKNLNFSTQKTMRLAQQLYEGVEIKGHGTIGLITYLRTDSTRVAEEADQAAKAFIGSHYGSDYVAGEEKARKSSAWMTQLISVRKGLVK